MCLFCNYRRRCEISKNYNQKNWDFVTLLDVYSADSRIFQIWTRKEFYVAHMISIAYNQKLCASNRKKEFEILHKNDGAPGLQILIYTTHIIRKKKYKKKKPCAHTEFISENNIKSTAMNWENNKHERNACANTNSRSQYRSFQMNFCPYTTTIDA